MPVICLIIRIVVIRVFVTRAPYAGSESSFFPSFSHIRCPLKYTAPLDTLSALGGLFSQPLKHRIEQLATSPRNAIVER